ncbi:hypothetical protein [Dickeya dadantii]|uniref:hypothetical protein n=1 Tax=Dickeya dadantii TaxID=204038 RepID=UPI003017F65C
MMKKFSTVTIRLVIFSLLSLPLGACTNGKIDPAKALTQMHVVKSDDYKERPGWPALIRLGIDDCETYKSGGGSLFKWDGLACDDKSIIRAVNSKPQTIPLFYATYHEYGSYEVGALSTFDSSNHAGEEAIKILVNLTSVLDNPKKVDAIYTDYEKDRWSMGLNKVSESDFKKIAASFAKEKEKIASYYQKTQAENQQKYKAENEARNKRDRENLLASDRPIRLILWANPTPEQQLIIDALNTIKFTVRSDGGVYANNRQFMSAGGLEYFRNSLDMTMSSCSDVGAYVGEKILRHSCVQGMARDIVKWGETAKDRSISDRAWRYAAANGSINYNPIKYEILFSHWAGMARVYASRGY